MYKYIIQYSGNPLTKHRILGDNEYLPELKDKATNIWNSISIINTINMCYIMDNLIKMHMCNRRAADQYSHRVESHTTPINNRNECDINQIHQILHLLPYIIIH